METWKDSKHLIDSLGFPLPMTLYPCVYFYILLFKWVHTTIRSLYWQINHNQVNTDLKKISFFKFQLKLLSLYWTGHVNPHTGESHSTGQLCFYSRLYTSPNQKQTFPRVWVCFWPQLRSKVLWIALKLWAKCRQEETNWKHKSNTNKHKSTRKKPRPCTTFSYGEKMGDFL